MLAAGAHVPVARAPVVHDGGVDVFLNCTSRLDDDNVVLAGCELLEAFVRRPRNVRPSDALAVPSSWSIAEVLFRRTK